MDYRMGVVVGLASGLLVGLLVVVLLRRRKVLDFTFDERQERARGVAFKYAFFTLLVSVFLYGVSEMAVGRWCDAMAGGCLCIAVSITVFAVICILKDAYLGLKERPRQIMTLFALIALVNLGLGAVQASRAGLLEDGVLSFRVVNPVMGVMMLVVLAVYIVNFLLRDREMGKE